MRKIKYLFLLVTMMAATTAWAQKYHDAKSDQIFGNAKSVTMSDGGGTQTMTYTNDGRIIMPGMSNPQYNGYGYMTGCNMTMNGMTGNMVFYYDSKWQVTKQVMSIAGGSITQEYTYNANGTVRTETTTMSGDGMTQSMTISYTYQTFDSHNSWTRRTATCNGQSTTEARTIVYW